MASKGGIADYSGITYEKIEKQKGVFWPCPSDDHPGTPRLFEKGSWNPIARGNGPFYFPDGRAHFVVAPYSPPTEVTDAEYPLILTTGRALKGTIRQISASCAETHNRLPPHLPFVTTALYCLQQLRAGLPVWSAKNEYRNAPDDEVRHVL